MTTDFPLCGGPYSWLTTTDKHTTTCRQTAGIVNPAFYVASFCVKISGTASHYYGLKLMPKFPSDAAQNVYPIFYRERQGHRWKERLRQIHMQISPFFWTLTKASRQAQTPRNREQWQYKGWVPTCNDNRRSQHGHAIRHLDRYLSNSRFQGKMIGSK